MGGSQTNIVNVVLWRRAQRCVLKICLFFFVVCVGVSATRMLIMLWKKHRSGIVQTNSRWNSPHLCGCGGISVHTSIRYQCEFFALAFNCGACRRRGHRRRGRHRTRGWVLYVRECVLQLQGLWGGGEGRATIKCGRCVCVFTIAHRTESLENATIKPCANRRGLSALNLGAHRWAGRFWWAFRRTKERPDYGQYGHTHAANMRSAWLHRFFFSADDLCDSRRALSRV